MGRALPDRPVHRFVAGALLLGALVPGTATALPGYTGLINSYCRSQGAQRVRYTDDGCTLCHHPGTFTSDPDHRVEPVWTEFEVGRSSGDYSFFCPQPGGTGSTITMADLNVPAPAELPAPSQGGPLSHAEMPWMSLGYPTGHAATEGAPGQAAQASNAASVASTAKAPAAAAVDRTAAQETKRALEKLRADLGISGSQAAAWLELQEAVLAVKALPPTPVEPPASVALPERLDVEERHHAQRIARLRAVNTALVRVNAQLNERQQRLLAARLPALLIAD